MQKISTFSISHAQNQSAYPLCLVEVSYTFVTWNNKAICRRSYIIIDTSFVVIICLMWNPSMAIYVYGMLMVLHSKISLKFGFYRSFRITTKQECNRSWMNIVIILNVTSQSNFCTPMADWIFANYSLGASSLIV